MECEWRLVAIGLLYSSEHSSCGLDCLHFLIISSTTSSSSCCIYFSFFFFFTLFQRIFIQDLPERLWLTIYILRKYAYFYFYHYNYYYYKTKR